MSDDCEVFRPLIKKMSRDRYRDEYIDNMWLSKCQYYKYLSLWVDDRMVYPDRGPVHLVNSDLPDDIRNDYEEAAKILGKSPRGAAALLRLYVQKICVHLGEKGDNLAADIGVLVNQGLDPKIQQALDTVRVVGNNAVHPGQFDLKDDTAAAESLFEWVNLIAEQMISLPKRLEESYNRLPDGDREKIDKRDAGKQAPKK